MKDISVDAGYSQASYAIEHDGAVFTPAGRIDVDSRGRPFTKNTVDEHNKAIEAAEIARLNSEPMPDRVTLYVGPYVIDAMGRTAVHTRKLQTWLGTKVGTCRATSSWPMPRSYVGSTMYQFEARINGQRYTGRGFGEGMSINLRKCR